MIINYYHLMTNSLIYSFCNLRWITYICNSLTFRIIVSTQRNITHIEYIIVNTCIASDVYDTLPQCEFPTWITQPAVLRNTSALAATRPRPQSLYNIHLYLYTLLHYTTYTNIHLQWSQHETSHLYYLLISYLTYYYELQTQYSFMVHLK